jgi:hypothetical protein
MDEATQKRAATEPGSRPIGPPEGKVIGAVAPEAVENVRAALIAAGFPADNIEIMTPDDLDNVQAPTDRPGFRGALNRFLFSLGGDLDELELARQELRGGHVLIGLPVQGDAVVHQVRDIMHANGAHNVRYFGKWTITSYD